MARVRVASVASSIWFSSSRSHGWDGFWTMSGIATRREGVVWMAWPAGPARSCRALSNYGFKLRYSNLFTDPPNPARRLGTALHVPCETSSRRTHASQECFIFACFSRFSGLHTRYSSASYSSYPRSARSGLPHSFLSHRSFFALDLGRGTRGCFRGLL